jgi:hypothetical protein
MSLYRELIQTTTVGAGGVSNIAFNSIPTIYSDLEMVVTGRTDAATTFASLTLWFNNDGSGIYSSTLLTGNGSSATSTRTASGGFPVGIGTVNAASSQTNTWTHINIYIADYANTSRFKTAVFDAVTENNSAAANQHMSSMLYRSNNAINAIALNGGGTLGFIQGTVLSLYGIKKS